LSISSRPFLSIFRASSEYLAISRSIIPFPLTWAKSLTLLNNEFAILGVPLDRPAISLAALSSICILSIPADLFIIK